MMLRRTTLSLEVLKNSTPFVFPPISFFLDLVRAAAALEADAEINISPSIVHASIHAFISGESGLVHYVVVAILKAYSPTGRSV